MLRLLRLAGVVPVAALAVGACGLMRPVDEVRPTARFVLAGDATPSFTDVPFPSDAYRANGHIVSPIPGFERVFTRGADKLARELSKLDGFSRIASVLFWIDDLAAPPEDDGTVAAATIDPASLPTDEVACASDASAVFLVDLEATDPAKARVACRADAHDDRAHGSATRPLVAIGPARGVVLAEAHRYAAVLTSRVKNAKGNRVAASADFARVRDGARSRALDALYGGAIDTARTLLAAALATDGAEIVAIAPFTTNAMTRELFQMRDRIETTPAPILAWDAAAMAPMATARFARNANGQLPAGFTASLDDWLGVVDPAAKLPDGTDDPDADLPVHAHDAIAAVGSAVFDATNFLSVKPNGYEDPDHATFVHDAAGQVVPPPEKPTAKIWVTFAIPTAPMPPTGYPAVIIGHGLGSTRQYLLDFANTFAKKGWIVVAIDSVTFGARAPEAMYQVDAISAFTKLPGATYAGPDGLADAVNGTTNGPSDLFGGLTSFGAFRDQLRQAELDTTQLVRVLRADPDLTPLATGAMPPKIDRDRVAYIGDSLGALEGAVSAALEPNLKAWTLNVLGSCLMTEVAPNAPGFGTFIGIAGAALFGFLRDYFTATHPMIVLVQTLLDAADPISYASRLVLDPAPLAGAPTKPRNVLQTEVLYDELMADEGGEAFARAAGFGLALPNVGSNAGARDPKNIAGGRDRVPFLDVAPDGANGIHDTPHAGVTGVVVQIGPAEHGSNLVRHKGHRKFAIPYARYDTGSPFTSLDMDKEFDVRNPYREIQATVVRFFGEAFDGKVPSVAGFAPAVRDFDDDGVMDDVDADPSNPRVH